MDARERQLLEIGLRDELAAILDKYAPKQEQSVLLEWMLSVLDVVLFRFALESHSETHPEDPQQHDAYIASLDQKLSEILKQPRTAQAAAKNAALGAAIEHALASWPFSHPR